MQFWKNYLYPPERWLRESNSIVEHIDRMNTEVFYSIALNNFYEKNKKKTETAKDKILELYVNTVNFGKGRGLKVAAQNWFGKDPLQLNTAECAFLAGLPQKPTKYAKDIGAAKQRQEEVLLAMVRNKVLSKEAAEYWKDFKLSFQKDSGKSIAPHFVDYANRELNSMNLDAKNACFTVVSTIDYSKQTAANEAVMKKLREFNTKYKELPAEWASGRFEEQELNFKGFNKDATYFGKIIADMNEEGNATVVMAGKYWKANFRNSFMDDTSSVFKNESFEKGYFRKSSFNKDFFKKDSYVELKVENLEAGIAKLVQKPMQAAFIEVSLEPESIGGIEAMVGNASDYFDMEENGMNNNVFAKRQVGSLAKIILSCLALQHGYSPEDIFEDKPGKGVGGWRVENYHDYGMMDEETNKWTYNMPLWKIVAKSKNCGAVDIFCKLYDRMPEEEKEELAAKLGINKIRYAGNYSREIKMAIAEYVDLAKKLGINIPPTKYGYDPTICLGTFSASLFEIARMNTAIANNGLLVEPYAVERVERKNNEVVFKRNASMKNALDEKIAGILREKILKRVVEEGTLEGIKRYCSENDYQKAFGKTWSTIFDAGVSFAIPGKHAVVCWVGYMDNRDLGKRTTGSGYGMPIVGYFEDKIKEKKSEIANKF